MTLATRKFADAPFGGRVSEPMNDVISTVILPAKKRFLYKIYDSAGNFITTWKDVIGEPKFNISINSGFSDLTLDLARSEKNYDEGASVKYGNILKLYVFDSDSRYGGVQIYSGLLSQYVPAIVGTKETIQVTFLSFWWKLDKMILENGSSTMLTYTSQDPSNILKDVLDKFVAGGGKIDYGSGSVDLTSQALTYIFNTATYQEALLKIIELCPVGWYLRIGADDVVYLKNKSVTPIHTFTLGKDIEMYQPEKRIENIINTVYFVGGGSPNFYKKYSDTGSVATYGVFAVKYVDEQVTTDAVASVIANRIINTFKDPEVRVQIKVSDNNGESFKASQGYDIESIKVGDTCQIKNATSKSDTKFDEALYDIDVFDYDITNSSSLVLQIVKIDYSPDNVLLELSNRQPDINKKIDDINRAFIDSITKDNPSSPS